MRMYTYVIPRDYGFAPNPYFNYCTLATCKPRIRKGAEIGDWIAAFGSVRSIVSKKLVMLMKVGEILTFDQYWEDPRFKKKRPIFNRGLYCAYGDNIYHHINEEWMQELSHHSRPDGSINYINLERDTKTDRVLIATEYYYFGNNSIDIPCQFETLIGRGRNHRIIKNEEVIASFCAYIKANYQIGIYGTPFSKKHGVFTHYKGENG